MGTSNRTRRQFLRDTLALTASAVVNRALHADETPSKKTVANDAEEFTLPDGRRLGYAEFGDPAGSRVIIHHHGLPSCRLEILIYQDIVANYPGLRILSVDRPGIGGSTPDPNASIMSWPADLVALAEALKVDRFAVVAPSAGAPYALAVARALPKRVTGVTLVGPMLPTELNNGRRAGSGAKELSLIKKHQALSTRVIGRKVQAMDQGKGQGRIAKLMTPASKRELMSDPKFAETYRRIRSETFRQGIDSVIASILQISAPWSRWLGEVATPVTILHGTEDKTVPSDKVPLLAAALPKAELRYIEGETHLSLPARRPELLLDAALESL
jgi:pimeloyl-ACP methyl ester carboxylesterase